VRATESSRKDLPLKDRGFGERQVPLALGLGRETLHCNALIVLTIDQVA